jgi:hypothetical protein
LDQRPGRLGRDTLKGPSIARSDAGVARDVHFGERFTGEFTFDLSSITIRVNVSDLNTVCECDLPPRSFGAVAVPAAITTIRNSDRKDDASEE